MSLSMIEYEQGKKNCTLMSFRASLHFYQVEPFFLGINVKLSIKVQTDATFAGVENYFR